MSIKEKLEKHSKKLFLKGAIIAALGGSATMAQAQEGDSIKQNQIEMTAKEKNASKMFENMYSNALYMKYRTDAGIFGKTQTPKDMVKKIKTQSSEYANNIIVMKRNSAPKEEIKETHDKQMSGVSVTNGNVYSYAYEKDGKRRIAQGELIGNAMSFLEVEKEERQFNNFLDMNKKNER